MASPERSRATAPTLAFTYQGEALGKRVRPLAQELGSDLVLPCDVEDIATVDDVFARSRKEWGELDFLVHSIAYSDKSELKGLYADTIAREFHPHAGHLLLLLHRGGAGAPRR